MISMITIQKKMYMYIQINQCKCNIYLSNYERGGMRVMSDSIEWSGSEIKKR